MAARITYRAFVGQGQDQAYHHGRIELWAHDVRGQFITDTHLSLRWQRGGTPAPGWYGFKVELEHCRSLGDLERSVKLARRVLRSKSEELWDRSPQSILDNLDRLRAVQVVYDSRPSRYVGLADILGPEHHAYRDDWRTMGKDGCTGAAVAKCEADAQAEIAGYLAKHDAVYLALWVGAGMPVVDLTKEGFSGASVPESTCARELFAVAE